MDDIVSAVNWEGEVYIFTRHGSVYKMYKDFSGSILFQQVYINLGQGR